MKQPHSVVPLGKLRAGETAVIVDLEKGDLALKLMEMGLLPGEKIFVDMVAPLGDPISIKIGNYLLSLRKEEANAVLVRR